MVKKLGDEIMTKLEEVSSKRLVIIDSFDARMNHVLMFAFTLLIGSVYTSFLLLVCSTIPVVASALLLFGSQIAMGVPATRAYYDLGVSNRENLHFIDPAKFNSNGQHHEVEISLGEIPLIFEKIDLQIQKYDKGSLDDLSDLIWFGIFVWATISSASFYLGISGYPVCLVGAVVLITACFGSYLSGYWTQRNYSFGDDLSHLQYYVEKRLREIDTRLPDNEARFFVQLLERWHVLVLVDFSLQLQLGNEATLEYHMGFPSNETERILLQGEADILMKLIDDLSKISSIVDTGWKTEYHDSIVVVINESSDFSVNKRSTFVTSPTNIDNTSHATSDIFSKILSLSTWGRLS